MFSSVSNGNAGPGVGTGGSPASVPWVTAVGASSQDRTFANTVTLGNGATYSGASVTNALAATKLVDAADAGAELCIVGELDPEVVAGNVVLCKRGVNARVEKSEAVDEAGGVGMVLYNAVSPQEIVTDNHFVPSTHLVFEDGLEVKEYIASAGEAATAALSAGTFTPQEAPDMAAFSSRGPNGAAPDLIKPDVTAPGVVILAGNSPTPFLGAPDQLFQAISGTSMSSPHTAGAGALLRQAHPTWTPAQIKSALMTTAYQEVNKEDGETPADPFDMGAGHIDPTPANDPGLTYNTDFSDYLTFLCGAGALNPNGVDVQTGRLRRSERPQPRLDRRRRARRDPDRHPQGDQRRSLRYVHGVGRRSSGSQRRGHPFDLDAGPAEAGDLHGEVHQRQRSVRCVDLRVADVERRHARRSQPDRDQARAAGGTHRAPTYGYVGSFDYDITFGFTGPFSADPHGLIPAETEAGNVVDDPANDIDGARHGSGRDVPRCRYRPEPGICG